MAKSKEEHIFAEKLTSDKDIDEDVLLNSFKQNQNNSLKTLLGLYKGQYFKLFLSVLLFGIKHTPRVGAANCYRKHNKRRNKSR